MRLLVQRVRSAKVEVDGEITGEIQQGLLIFLGIAPEDGQAEVDFLAGKAARLRIFEDDKGKMNLSVADVGGGCLVVSQFTLYGDCRKGNRPSFIAAARPEHAIPLYESFVETLRGHGLPVATGVFGAEMMVSLENDGPVTLWLES